MNSIEPTLEQVQAELARMEKWAEEQFLVLPESREGQYIDALRRAEKRLKAITNKMNYPLASSTWGEEEVQAAISVLRSGRCTQGEITKQFEAEFARTFGVKHAVFVNSGSSANLLAVASQLYVSDNPLRAGDEVLVPAVAWATTYFPLHQCGLKIRLVDIDPETLNTTPEECFKYCNSATRVRGIQGVNLLGNPVSWGLFGNISPWVLLEDNCESMGASLPTLPGQKDRYTGTFGKVGTFSFYFSHHLTTIEGGMAVTDDDETADIMRCLRAHGWTRDLPEGSKLKQSSGDPWQDRYRFILPGYNVRGDDLRAAIGRVQLKRLPTILEGRRRNAEIFKACLADLNKNELLATGQKETGRSSWYGFALILQGRLRGRRKELVAKLEENGVETRPVMSSAIYRQPVAWSHWCNRNFGTGIFSGGGTCPNADYLHDDGFFIGNRPQPLADELEQTFKIIKRFADGSCR